MLRSAYCLRCFILLSVLLSAIQARSEELRLSARQLFERSSVQNLQLSADGKSIELIRGLLIENDGDAAGFSYKPNEENLSDGTIAIKWLTIPDHVKKLDKVKATLLVGHTGKNLNARINGERIELGEPQKAGNYWKRFEIPGRVLRVGKNEVRISGEGKLWIARHDDASTIEGEEPRPHLWSVKTKSDWSDSSAKLGPQNDIDGEYYVRLYLEHVPRYGYLELPPLDALAVSGRSVAGPSDRVRGIRVRLEGDWELADRPEMSMICFNYLHGGPKIWFPSNAINAHEFDCHAIPPELFPRPSWLEIKLNGGAMPPRLTGMRIETTVTQTDAWGTRLKVIDNRMGSLLQDFQFESLDHPCLAQFRKQYKLDEVVKGCTTDFERMQKLAVWSSQQWTKGHLKDIYPKWDALEILKLHEDGTPVGGFCQQYNIVFLQACESLGMVGRCVSIGAGDHGVNIRSGHEVVEIWSNELNKWVYVDGQAAWYFIDKETRTPLNLLELRERQIAALTDKPFRETEVVVLAKSPYEWKGLKEWPAFCELRMIPHTQFLDGKLPLPLNQGMRGWFWTGHRVWTDELMPASILYDKRITNPRDWNFTVNQTQFWLTQREKEGELDVRLDHNMPSWDHFVVKFDDGQEQIENKRINITWPLKKGENRLQVQAVNKLGVRGPASWAKVQYD